MTHRTPPRVETVPRRAYSYQRVSQVKSHGHGDSLDRQSAFAEEIARENGWTLDETLTFSDRGKSGYHAAHRGPTGALTRLLDAIKTRRILPGSVIIIEQLDRLTREAVWPAQQLFMGILEAGVWIATQTPRRIYRGDQAPTLGDIMEPVFLAFLAHQESEAKSTRGASAWVAARRGARESKRPTIAGGPLWVRREGERWQLVPERAALARRIVSMLTNGTGCGEVARVLNAEGGPSVALTRAGSWSASTVRQLATSKTLIGEYQPCRRVEGKRVPEGPPIAGYYPPVLTEEERSALLASLGRRRGKTGRAAGPAGVNVLRGLLWDTASGRRMSLATKTGWGKARRYLSVGDVAGCVRVPYDQVAEAVLATLSMLRPEDVLPPDAARDAAQLRLADLTARSTALVHRQGLIQAALADPDQDPAALLPALVSVTAEVKATALAREQLQVQTHDGRGEALGEGQALIALRASVSGAEREGLDRRIQHALPQLVRRVDVATQKISPRAQVVTLSIRLHAGGMREVILDPRGM